MSAVFTNGGPRARTEPQAAPEAPPRVRCMRSFAQGFDAGDRWGSRVHFIWGFASGACAMALVLLGALLAWKAWKACQVCQALKPIFF